MLFDSIFYLLLNALIRRDQKVSIFNRDTLVLDLLVCSGLIFYTINNKKYKNYLIDIN